MRSERDTNLYLKGVRVPDAEIDAPNRHRHEVHGDWTYTIKPNSNPES